MMPSSKESQVMAHSPDKSSAYPEIGTPAPKFTALASSGESIKLMDYRGEIVVLYFYPKDDTSGCTKEACGFRDNHKKLTDAGVVVLGVSPDSVPSHQKFVSKYKLPFLLLSDPDHVICEAYGAWQQKSMYGRKYMGVARTTFVIDKTGHIAHVFEKVKPADHDEEVLAWIQQSL
jgi:peroxiredoxin Q/BCP